MIIAAAAPTTTRPHTERSPRPPSHVRPPAPPHVPLVNSAHAARTAHSAQQVQHACTTFNRLLDDFFTRKFIQAESDGRLFVYFLCFLFSLPLPSFLKPLVLLSLSLSLPQLGWSELLSSTAWIRRTGPVRSTLPAIDFRDVHRQLQKRRFPLSIPENLNPLYGKIDLYDDV